MTGAGTGGREHAAELLLADPSPALRVRVLTELLDAHDDDPELVDLAGRVPGSAEVVAVDAVRPGSLAELAHLLCRYGTLGLGAAYAPVATHAATLLAAQGRDGSFPIAAFRTDDRYTMIPMQVAIPLRGLAMAGYATDERVERAYDWLLDRRLPDGSWPTGIAAGQPGSVAGYRTLAGSPGCRVNTLAAVACLAAHPHRRHHPAARTGLELLLAARSRDAATLGTELACDLGVEPRRGFVSLHARIDLAFLAVLAGAVGAEPEAPGVGALLAALDGLRLPSGLWAHPAHPELSYWLSLELLRAVRLMELGSRTARG